MIFLQESIIKGYEPLSRDRLKHLHKKIKLKTGQDTSDAAAVNRARKYANKTGGGPSGPAEAYMDRDIMEDLNPLSIIEILPIRDGNSLVITADGTAVQPPLIQRSTNSGTMYTRICSLKTWQM